MPKFQETWCSQCGKGFGPGDSGYSHCWDHCKHEWELAPGDWDCPTEYAYVECKKCECPGQRTESTGEVYWPAT